MSSNALLWPSQGTIPERMLDKYKWLRLPSQGVGEQVLPPPLFDTMAYEDGDIMAYEPDDWFKWLWQKRIQLTINASQVPSTQNNFPLLINSIFPSLIGAVEADLRFTKADNIQLEYEIEEFDSITGELIAWVLLPTISVGDKINIYYNFENFLSNFNFSGDFLDTSSEDTSPRGLFFTDPLTLFVIGEQNDKIYKYILTTPNDITTAVFSGDFLFVSLDTSLQDLFFSDPSTLFVVGNQTKRVRKFNLSIPNDLSTAVADGEFPVLTEEFEPTGLFFTDTSTMFIIGRNSDKVHKYILSTPNDITTAVYTGDFLDVSPQETVAHGLFFSDPSTLFIIGPASIKVHKYNLTTPNDITTAVYSGQFLDTSAEDTSPRGLFFSDPSTLFVIGQIGNRIYKYKIQNIDEQNPNAVWDDDYGAVYHMNQTSFGANSILDSTKNNNNGTPSSPTTPSSVNGQIGKAYRTNGDGVITIPDSPSIDVMSDSFTLSCWIDTFNPVENFYSILDKRLGFSGVGINWWTDFRGSGRELSLRAENDGGGDILFDYGVTGDGLLQNIGKHYVTFTYNAVTREGRSSIDNVFGDTIGISPAGSFSINQPLMIGRENNPDYMYDEIRISRILRSVDWQTTEYNNQFNPGAFYSIGAEETREAIATLIRMGYEI